MDEFWKEFEPIYHQRFLACEGKRPNRKTSLSMAEIMTILAFFHVKGFRCFKHYYIEYVSEHMRDLFPDLVSYSRFVELTPRALFPLMYYQLLVQKAEQTGIAYIDSTTLAVCRNQRIHNHKVFKNLADRGKSSMGWFYGFKLHLIVNDQGGILAWCLTPGNVSDKDVKTVTSLAKGLQGKLFADKGYISRNLFEPLFEQGLQLITKIQKNMKNKLMPMVDQLLLRKRAIIETIIDQLKNISQIQHTRHRSPLNFMVNITAGLVAYGFYPNKPSVRFGRNEFLPLEL